MTAQKPIKLSPSDLTFLWDECKRCFYLKYNRKISRPFGPMPSIFGVIDNLMKDFYSGKSTSEITPELPPGVVKFGEKWVESEPIILPGLKNKFSLRGKFDSIIAFEDGSFGVIDFKTSKPKPYHIPFYGRQLHAYAYALEHALQNKFALSPISKLGLLVFEPGELDEISSQKIAFLGDVTWMEIPRQNDKFFQFLHQVFTLLEQEEPPKPGERCAHCKYRSKALQLGF